MRRIKNFFKETVIWFMVFALVCWSISIPLTTFIKNLKAAGTINIVDTDDGGASPDVFLSASSTPESIIKITAYDTDAAGTLNSVTVQIEAGMNCPFGGGECTDSPFVITDMGSITATASSGISIWLDDGDETFELYGDTLISSTTATQASAWTTQTITDSWGSFTVSETTFSNLNLTVPTSFSSPLVVFVAARAENNIDASTLHKFNLRIPENGIDVTAGSGGSITDGPSPGFMSMPVTLGAEGSGDNMQNSAPLVISEIQIASSTAAVEFIEIHNVTSQSYDLIPSNGTAGADAALGNNLNLHIVDCTGTTGTTCTGTTTNPTLTLTTNTDSGDDIAANGYFLIASDDWNTNWSSVYGTPDATYDASTGMNANGGVYISASSTVSQMVIDMVGWGSQTQTIEGMAAVSPPSNGSLERKAYPSSNSTSMLGVDSSRGNASDSNNNSGDFVTRDTNNVDPQNTSSSAESDVITSSERNIVINEIFYNTASSSSWIELYNASSTAISINAWTLNVATSTTQTYTIPNVSVNGQSFVTVYWNQTGTNDTDTSDGQGSLYTGNVAGMSAFGGDVTLKNSGSTIIDYIQFGGSGKAGESAAVTAGEWTTGDFKSNSTYGESIARIGTTGDDYNASSDWMFLSTPTANLPNTGGDSTAPDAVTNVRLSDPDSTAFGLEGQDVRVSWVPSSTSDPNFDRYEVYLLADGTALNTAVHSVYNTSYGQYMWENATASSSYAFIGGGYSMSFDSAGNALSTGSYRAYVVSVDMAGNKSASVSSAAATLTAESGGTDTNPPMIDHMPVWQAPISTDLTFYARMGDDRSISTTSLAYRTADPTTAWGNATSTCAQPAMAGNTGLYSCSVSFNTGAGWDADTTFYYYLIAIDSSGNDTYLSMYPTNTESTAQSAAVDSGGIDFMAAADWNDAGTVADLSGTVFDSTGNPLQDAFVIIDGVSTSTATTTSSGAFSFNDNAMPSGSQFIRIIKNGYIERVTDTDHNSNFIIQNASGLEFYLNSGYMSTSAGGSGGSNGISWTAPSDGMMMAPTNISCTGDCSTIGSGEMPIIVSFFNQMNANTIDNMDASSPSSNIYLTSDGNTKISGIKVKYDSGNNEARIYSSTALSADTFYMVVLTPSVLDANGNPIESNRPSGNYEFSFSTMGDNSSMWGGGGTDYTNYGSGGMYTPPYVKGTNPTSGAFNIPPNSSVTVEFSETMDPSVTSAVKLYPITSEANWTRGTEAAASVTLDNATKKLVTINPTSNMSTATADNGWYEIVVMASAKSQLGMWMGTPASCGAVSPDTCLASTVHFTSSFQITSTEDATAPTVAGTYPANNDGISNTSVVDVGLSSIEIGFSEAMDPSTINSQSITLKKGTVSVAGTVKYDSMTNGAKYIPSNALSANNVYTLTITTSVTDLSGIALAANNIISFKTGSPDTASPSVLYANGDDYQIAITYSEPMNAAPQTDTTNWTNSVLNPANYYINTLDTGSSCTDPAPGSWGCSHNAVGTYNTANGNQISTLNNITLSYDNESQTVTLSGFSMCTYSGSTCSSGGSEVGYFQIFVDNVKDKSNNTINHSGNRSSGSNHDNGDRPPIQSSASTYGQLGPMGGPGMMMGGGGPGSTGAATGPGMDMGMMGMFGGGAFPMNQMAGQTSNYMLDIPVTKALQNGMQIVLTFPTGFNVSGVAKDTNSSMNSDMNDWNGGVVTWDTTYGVGGISSTTSKVITMQLNVSTSSTEVLNTTAGPDGFIDFLHIDLKGIVNSSIPKDFGTSGYTVDIKTKSSDGTLLENVTTMPFFITESGSITYEVVITAPSAGTIASTTNVYLGSPMTGPQEAESTNFVSNVATSTFTNILAGDYMLFTDPYITIGSNNYLGNVMPEFLQISANGTSTITLELEAAGAGKAAVTVQLTGDYSTGGTADNVDIFANSPAGFRVKTLSNVGSTDPSSTIYLTEGEWTMGVGPAMPKGPMAGPPKMPDWMEPQTIFVTVGIETATSRDLDADGDSSDATTSNTEPVLLNIASTNNLQVGDVVTFATGAAGATTTITDLVVNTSITVTPQANWDTLPAGTDTITSIRESSVGANDGKVHFDVSSQTLMNINGFVVDASGNAIGNAEVYAYQPQGFGGGHTTSDTSGKFSLKIGQTGVWTVGSFKPGMPSSQEKSVEVKSNSSNTDGNTTADVYLNGTLIADASNDNAGTNPLRLKIKRPSYTISGKVLNSSDQAVPSARVWAYQPTSWGYADTNTDSSGNYILYVDAETWTIEADAPGVGWLQYDTTITITTSNQSNINLRPASGTSFYDIQGTVTVDGAVQTYMPVRAVKYDSNGNTQGREYIGSTDSSGNYTISVPTGIYRVDVWTQSYGEIELDYDMYANSPANINHTAATTTADITVAAADLQTVSIQFTNGTASQTGFLRIEEMDFSNGYPQPTGYMIFKDISGLNATTTVKLKGTAAGKYYFFDLDIPGYGSFTPTAASKSLLTNAYDCIKLTDAARAVYFTLTDAITGTITVSGSVEDDSSNALTSAWVWLGNFNSQFHTGVETDSSGNFSLTIPALSSGNYKLGADKSGYLSAAPADVSGTASSTSNTITLTANSLTISGTIYTDSDSNGSYTGSSEAIPDAWVWAEETSTGQMTYDTAGPSGTYSLGVSAGTWKVSAGVDGYQDGTYKVSSIKTNVTVGASSVTSIDVALTSDSNWTLKTKSKPITPASGGTIDDTATSSTGVKVTIPPLALGQSQNSGNVTIQNTSAVTETTSAKPLGGIGKAITATDNSNEAINNLGEGKYLDIELNYYQDDINNMGLVDLSKLKNLSGSYWDNSSNSWVNLSTTRKAYYNASTTATDWILMEDTATQTGYEEFIDDLAAGTSTENYKLVFTAKSNHLTVFSATQPQDALSPSAPTGLAQSSGSGSSVVLTWSAVTTNSDSTAITDLLGYEIYRSTDDSTYTQLNTSDIATNSRTYNDSSVSSFTSYYYKVTAADDGGNETALANSTALRICSNMTVSNGTVASDCAITCNSGYTVNGNACQSSGGAVISTGGGGSGSSDTSDDTEEEDNIVDEIVEETKEVITEVVDTAKQAAQEFAQKLVDIASDAAEIIKANINSLLGKLGFKRELAKEEVAVKKYVKELIKDITGISKDNEHALTNFVAYGTETTQILGEGERAGVVNSYKSAFGKLPSTEAEWNDVIKIGNGRWPSETNDLTEANATESFKKIYLRDPNRTNPHDDAAVVVMAYGLRPADRNLDSEKAAIKIFKGIYGYNPKSATAWDIVRAIAYSGATR